MRRILGLSLLLPLSAHALEGFSARIEVQTWMSHTQLEQQSAYNPGNAFAHLPETRAEQQWRPDLSWQKGDWQLLLKPRLVLSSTNQHHDLWLNEGSLRWQHQGWGVQAGREVLLWGPSMFWSPSNAFYRSNGRSQPTSELMGHDLVRIERQVGERSRWQLIRQFTHGHEPNHAEQGVWASRLEMESDSSSGALVLSQRDQASLQLGAYGQWTVSDGLLLYTDTQLARREGIALAQPAASPTGWALATPSTAYRPTVLVGSAYTWENGITVNLEGLYHGNGLSADEANQQNQSAADLAGQLNTINAPLAAPQLGALIDPGLLALRRSYLALQVMDSSAVGYGWTVRAAHNLDDHSSELVLQGSYDINDRWRLWSNGLLHTGQENSEWGRLLRSAVWVGVSGYF